jgi:hypothetical protein
MANSRPIPMVEFRVPHTQAGLRWIEQARQYVNRERFGELATRPRGGTRGPSEMSCQRHDCTMLGVYLRERPEMHEQRRKEREEYHGRFIPRYEHRQEVGRLQSRFDRLAGQLRDSVEAHNQLEGTHGETVGDLWRANKARQRWITAAMFGPVLAFLAGIVVGGWTL